VTKSPGTIYWSAGGERPAGTIRQEYVFFAGKRLARLDFSDGKVRYYLSDHLGSTSIVTDDRGCVLNESDYYPYGGEMVVASARDFANSIQTGGPNPASNTWIDASGHPAYNDAVNDIELGLERTEGESDLGA
jgi:hypothetical protein